MTDKPNGKWLTPSMTLALAFAIYMGAYYATYTIPRGIKFGTGPHYEYKLGSWTVPSAIGYRFFYPAHKLDQCIRPHEGD